MNNLSLLLQTRDISTETIRQYESHLPEFGKFVAEHGLNHATFLEYKRLLAKRTDIAVATKNMKLSTARIVLSEAARLGQIPNITIGVKGFSDSRKHKRMGFTDAQVKTIFEKCTDIRLAAMLHLLAYQGLRQVEVCRLDVTDIDFSNSTALVQGKGMDGSKEMIHLHPKTVEALSEYLKTDGRRDGAIFTNASNNSTGTRVTVRGLRSTVTAYLQKIGVSGNVHGFRHFFTTRLIAKMKNLTEVQKYTRHRSLEVLQNYQDNLDTKESLPNYYAAMEI